MGGWEAAHSWAGLSAWPCTGGELCPRRSIFTIGHAAVATRLLGSSWGWRQGSYGEQLDKDGSRGQGGLALHPVCPWGSVLGWASNVTFNSLVPQVSGGEMGKVGLGILLCFHYCSKMFTSIQSPGRSSVCVVLVAGLKQHPKPHLCARWGWEPAHLHTPNLPAHSSLPVYPHQHCWAFGVNRCRKRNEEWKVPNGCQEIYFAVNSLCNALPNFISFHCVCAGIIAQVLC